MSKIKVSNSMLVATGNCDTLAALRTANYSIKEGDDDRKMVAGHCAHLALEDWLQGAPSDICLGRFKTEYEPYSNQFIPSDNAYHHDNLRIVMEHFFDTHPLAEMTFETVLTEKEIEAELCRKIREVT